MIDKRKHYTMEQHYCFSDFDFYKNREGSSQVGRVLYDQIASGAGRELWVLVETYSFKGRWENINIMVLQNKEGVQIETAGYGWRNVPTEHDLALRQKREYHAFIDKLAALEAPAGLRRWHNEVIEMFENTYEEILYYGAEE